MNTNYWKDKKILIVGASSDICQCIIPDVLVMNKVGLHYNSNSEPLLLYKNNDNVRLFQEKFEQGQPAIKVVDDFISWAGGIDFLVIMVGNCRHPVYWEKLTEEDMLDDYYINTIVPFFLAKEAQKHMRTKGGRIIFTGTASAQNAGGSNSLSYGSAKLGLECIMKRMAKDCAQYNILINMVAPGFILTKFQKQTMKRSDEEIKNRSQFIPLKRPGNFKEVAAPYLYLLSENTSFVTGEVVNVKGGDWI